MYANFSNHFYNGVHYIFAFLLLVWILPKVMFREVEGDFAERVIGNYMKMVLFIIASGYLLVTTKLFEVLSIIGFIVIFIFLKSIILRSKSTKDWIPFTTGFFEYTEGRFKLVSVIKPRIHNYIVDVKKRVSTRFRSPWTLSVWILLAIVITGSGYVRFYDAVAHAAPAMSDAYTVLEWMKDIDNRELFNTGIYPKGFHIYLDTLFKFAKIDALYIQKYTGPLNVLLVIFGMYFIVSRYSEDKYAGIVAAIVYGWLGFMHASDWERHAATNSQEFAMVFLFPTLYFFRKYLRTAENRFLWISFSGLAVVGLVHQLIYAYLCFGIVILTMVHLFGGIRKYLYQIIWIAGIGFGSVIISIIPVGIGFAMGKRFQEAAEQFLVSQSTGISYPQLHVLDMVALAASVILLVAGVMNWRTEKVRTVSLFTGLYCILTFVLYYWGGVITNSVVIASRTLTLWNLIIPVTLGMTWGILFVGGRERWMMKAAEIALVSILMMAVLYQYPLQPILPYKMERDNNLEQYLAIKGRHPNKTWAIFAQEEGYGVIEGSGFHFYIATLLQEYDPTYKYLTKTGETSPNLDIPGEIYIFEEKEVFRTHFEHLAVVYDRREREMIELKEWINKYREANGEIEIFYEDEYLRIYHISRPISKDETIKKIWGE